MKCSFTKQPLLDFTQKAMKINSRILLFFLSPTPAQRNSRPKIFLCNLRNRLCRTKKDVPEQLYGGCVYNVTNHINQLVKDGRAKEECVQEKKVYLRGLVN